MQEAMVGLPGVLNIADDVLIFGSGTTQEEMRMIREHKLLPFIGCLHSSASPYPPTTLAAIDDF